MPYEDTEASQWDILHAHDIGGGQCKCGPGIGCGAINKLKEYVRRVETVILDEDEEDDAGAHVRTVGAETYDLTYSDNDADWIMFKDPGEGQGEAHFVGYEDLVDGGGLRAQKKGCNKVNFVRTVAGGEGTLMILDSGDDISVLPMSYREVGFPLELFERCSRREDDKWRHAPSHG